MKNKTQPQLHQVQYLIKSLRIKNGSSHAKNDVNSITQLMSQWKLENTQTNERAFFFGYDTDPSGSIVIEDLKNFTVAITSKSLLSHFRKEPCYIYHMDSIYKVNKARFPFLVFGRSDYSGQFHP